MDSGDGGGARWVEEVGWGEVGGLVAEWRIFFPDKFNKLREIELFL